jgi:hypothetical protein
VEVALGASPTLGAPRRLFTRPTLSVPTILGWAPGFDVTGDGRQFLFFRDPRVGVVKHDVIVVQNWFAEFGARKGTVSASR